ncbi:hypothetical protein KP509_34G028400 [Ceratopteris richardii]|uniref:Protein kinase domain-containing protein n=1 Tax=Ceratopteris richardii TaxID=49495 RepID=A0A8T2QJQ0_CERRI|nr:hypothetical protein KP509_34G028400 [Ceratopteris richardii]
MTFIHVLTLQLSSEVRSTSLIPSLVQCVGATKTAAGTRIYGISSSTPSSSAPAPLFVVPIVTGVAGRLSTHCTILSDLNSVYSLGRELGRAQYGIIRSCKRRSSGALFACKSIARVSLSDPQQMERIMSETCIMKRLSNSTCSFVDGIVRLHDIIEDKDSIHLILELCRGGDLYERITENKRYTEVHAAFLMKSLLESIHFCHSMGIIDRDIKPENILLLDNSETSPIKLADFGLALEFTKGQTFSGLAGSSYYMAPEIFQGEYSEEVDIWSAGVIMYIVLSGVPPFWGPTEQRIYKAIQKGEVSLSSKLWDFISDEAKDLISKMLHPYAKSRIAVAEAMGK